MKYRTKSLQTSASLMAQKEFDVFYLELQATDKLNKFEFIFEIDAEEAEFNTWINKYINRRVCVEPKLYDDSLNILRDGLALQKGRVSNK